MLPYTETYLFTNIYGTVKLILSITYKYVNSIFISESYEYLKLLRVCVNNNEPIN